MKFATVICTLQRFMLCVLRTIELLPLVFRALIITPLILIALISIIQWSNTSTLEKPVSIINSARIQHPNYHNIAKLALHNLSLLAPVEQHQLIANLKNNLIAVKQWQQLITSYRHSLICLGESHLEATREFIATQVLTQLPVTALYLEVQAHKLAEIQHQLAAKQNYYPLLGADILQVLRSAKSANPQLQIYPIEASKKQMKATKQGKTTRELSIVNNFIEHYNQSRTMNASEPQRHIVLIGGLHCSDEANWFFAMLKNTSTLAKLSLTTSSVELINLQVFNEHQDGPIETFVYFLDELKLVEGDFVIANTAAFSPLIKRWFALSQRVTFAPFKSIVIYRSSVN